MLNMQTLIVIIRSALLVFVLYLSTNLLHVHIKRKRITVQDIKNVSMNAFLSAIICICVLSLFHSFGLA